MLTGGNQSRRRPGLGCACNDLRGADDAPTTPSLTMSPVVHGRVKSLTSIIALVLGAAGLVGLLVRWDTPRRKYRSGEGRSRLGIARARATMEIPRAESMSEVVEGRLQ